MDRFQKILKEFIMYDSNEVAQINARFALHEENPYGPNGLSGNDYDSLEAKRLTLNGKISGMAFALSRYKEFKGVKS